MKNNVNEETVRDIIESIDQGHLLLPDFQRDFDWRPEEQKALIASFLYNVPIGSMLFLENRADILTKKIGCKTPDSKINDEKKSYLMDGQQRLTTLKSVFDDFFKHDSDRAFNDLYNNLKYRWFLKLKIFSEADKIEKSSLRIILDIINKGEISYERNLSDVEGLIAHVKIIKTRQKRGSPYHPKALTENVSDFRNYLETEQRLPLFLFLTTTEKGAPLARKYKELLIEPAAKIFKEKWFEKIKEGAQKQDFAEILKEYNISVDLNKPKEIEEISKQWADDLYDSLRAFLTEKRKLITITYKDLSKAVAAFTAMNSGGLALSSFDIIAARYAALKKRELLKDRIKDKFKEVCAEDIDLLPKIDTDKLFSHFANDKSGEAKKFYDLYLNMLGIFSTSNSNNLQQDCIKDKKKLSLTKEDIDRHTGKAVRSAALAFRFLSGYCGVSKVTDVSYQLMILPIAKNLYDRKENIKKKDIYKIFYWYWSSLFGGRYREKQNSRSIEDIGFLQSGNLRKIKCREIFSDAGYSDFESLKNNEAPSLEAPVLQFIFANKILNSRLDNFQQAAEALASGPFEVSHLISLDDYNKKTEPKQGIKRSQKHYINSPLNLALLPKDQNQFDRSKSWPEWNQDRLKEAKILIPEKIEGLGWDSFSKKFKNANPKEMERLREDFAQSRFDEIKQAVSDRLESAKKQWEK